MCQLLRSLQSLFIDCVNWAKLHEKSSFPFSQGGDGADCHAVSRVSRFSRHWFTNQWITRIWWCSGDCFLYLPPAKSHKQAWNEVDKSALLQSYVWTITPVSIFVSIEWNIKSLTILIVEKKFKVTKIFANKLRLVKKGTNGLEQWNVAIFWGMPSTYDEMLWSVHCWQEHCEID